MSKSFFYKIIRNSALSCTECSGNSDDKHKVNIKDKYIDARSKNYSVPMNHVSCINTSIAIYRKE